MASAFQTSINRASVVSQCDEEDKEISQEQNEGFLKNKDEVQDGDE
jgi:hypothetical protein